MPKRKSGEKGQKGTPQSLSSEPENLPDEEQPEALKKARKEGEETRKTLRNLGDVIRYSGPRF